MTVARTFDTPLITSDQSIDRVLAAGQPVALIFLEGSASPSLEQTMTQLAREYAGQLLVVQVPAKDSPRATRQYQVQRFPAVVTVRQGQTLSKAEAISGTELKEHVAFLLGKGARPQTPTRTNGHPKARVVGQPHPASDATFDKEVMQSPEPVLVDFWAPWCGPCRMVEPVIEKLAQEMAGRLRVVKINVDQNPATAQKYRVQGIPTMMVVKNGQIVDRWSGALPEGALRSRVMPFLG